MGDIMGKRFDRLTAIRPTDMRKRRFVVWKCRCDCGATAFVMRGALVSGNTKSYGCLLRETAGKMRKSEWVQQETDAQSITQKECGKLGRNNTSGHRGVVYRAPLKKYVAEIEFQWKECCLGAYKNVEDAVEVRRKAEKLILDEGDSFYQKWKARAETDAVWAKENPIRFRVTKTNEEGYLVAFSSALADEELD